MGRFGSAPKALPVGRTASLLNIRSLLTSLFSEYWRIARARYGLAVWAPQLPEGSVRFPVAASVASEMMVVSATAWSAYMRTAGAISGRESKTGCGDGSLVLRSSIRCPVKWTVYKPSVKTLMAHFWSGGRAESTGSWTEKPKRIHSPALWVNSGPTKYSAIEMVVYGSRFQAGALS